MCKSKSLPLYMVDYPGEKKNPKQLFRVKSSIIKTTHAYFRKVKAKKNKEQRKNKVEKNHCNPEITAVKVT